jgi:tetratricopeptide (TPR) repeat protein
VRAVGDHPDDLPAREGLGVALAWAGNLEAALAACEATLARAPKRELVLSDAGLIAQRLGLNENSLGYWRRALDINPHSSRYRFEVANALVVRGDWPAAVEECRAVLAANGGHVPSRLVLMQYHWESGAKDKARAELVAILSLRPPNEAMLRQRFAEILR